MASLAKELVAATCLAKEVLGGVLQGIPTKTGCWVVTWERRER